MPYKPPSDQEMIFIIAKLFNKNPEIVAKSADLFTDINPIIRRCLEELAKLEGEDPVNFLMLVDYFFIGNRSAKEILKDLEQ